MRDTKLYMTEHPKSKMLIYALSLQYITGNSLELTGLKFKGADSIVRDVFLLEMEHTAENKSNYILPSEKQLRKGKLTANGLWHSHGTWPPEPTEEDLAMFKKPAYSVWESTAITENVVKRKIPLSAVGKNTRIHIDDAHYIEIKGHVDKAHICDLERFRQYSLIINNEGEMNAWEYVFRWDGEKFIPEESTPVEIVILYEFPRYNMSEILDDLFSQVHIKGEGLDSFPEYSEKRKKLEQRIKENLENESFEPDSTDIFHRILNLLPQAYLAKEFNYLTGLGAEIKNCQNANQLGDLVSKLKSYGENRRYFFKRKKGQAPKIKNLFREVKKKLSEKRRHAVGEIRTRILDLKDKLGQKHTPKLYKRHLEEFGEALDTAEDFGIDISPYFDLYETYKSNYSFVRAEAMLKRHITRLTDKQRSFLYETLSQNSSNNLTGLLIRNLGVSENDYSLLPLAEKGACLSWVEKLNEVIEDEQMNLVLDGFKIEFDEEFDIFIKNAIFSEIAEMEASFKERGLETAKFIKYKQMLLLRDREFLKEAVTASRGWFKKRRRVANLEEKIAIIKQRYGANLPEDFEKMIMKLGYQNE